MLTRNMETNPFTDVIIILAIMIAPMAAIWVSYFDPHVGVRDSTSVSEVLLMSNVTYRSMESINTSFNCEKN